MAKRILRSDSSQQTAIENSLNQYDPFIVAHLIKFEKPISNIKGTTIDADSYSYFTDNSYDITFNDSTVNPDNSAQGDKIYRANKVLSIGTVNENIIAKAAGMSIKFDASALSTQVSTSGTFSNSAKTFASTTDLSSEGFQEGDSITFSGISEPFTITGFTNGGKTISFRV